MKDLIIQVSPFHTASTLLINILYGLSPSFSDIPVIGDWFENWETLFDSDKIIIKCHNIFLDELIDKYSQNYNVYFICSERKEKNLVIEEKYKSYNNVIVFQYEELDETSENSIENIVTNVYNRVKNIFNEDLSIDSALRRVDNMKFRYEEIKDEPFTYIDHFYQIHGSHRFRTNDR
jgi:hypothetical protein